jgi:hypothetical protein
MSFLPLLGLPVVVVDLGVDVAGADGVDIDAEAPPLQRHRPGHLHHGGLAHAVHANLRQHLEARHAGNVDDAPAGVGAGCGAAGPRQHALADFLRHKEGALDVGVEDEVVVGFFHVLDALGSADARVVDEDVDRANLRLRMRHGRLHAVKVGHVQRQHVGVTASGLDLGAQGLELFHTAAGQHHGGPGARQGFGELGPQAARRAGDEGNAAREVDAVRHARVSCLNCPRK